MFKWIYPVLLAFLYSCASISGEWGPWSIEDVPTKEREWRFCKEELDGPGFHPDDRCYQSEECRRKKVLFGGEKKECRKATLSCKHGDVECLNKYGILDMTISNKK